MDRRACVTAVLAAVTLAGAFLLARGLTAVRTPAAAPLPPRTVPTRAHFAPSERQAAMPAPGVRIPALGATARITSIRVTDDDLEPPRDPGTVGLWNGSAPLDPTYAAGEITLAGHVDWAGMPTFAFARLADLAIGDLIYTTDAHGSQAAWRVTALRTRLKSEGLDPAAFAGTSGPRRLALITCGGPYDPVTGSYLDNIYAYANPAGAG